MPELRYKEQFTAPLGDIQRFLRFTKDLTRTGISLPPTARGYLIRLEPYSYQSENAPVRVGLSNSISPNDAITDLFIAWSHQGTKFITDPYRNRTYLSSLRVNNIFYNFVLMDSTGEIRPDLGACKTAETDGYYAFNQDVVFLPDGRAVTVHGDGARVLILEQQPNNLFVKSQIITDVPTNTKVCGYVAGKLWILGEGGRYVYNVNRDGSFTRNLSFEAVTFTGGKPELIANVGDGALIAGRFTGINGNDSYKYISRWKADGKLDEDFVPEVTFNATTQQYDNNFWSCILVDHPAHYRSSFSILGCKSSNNSNFNYIGRWSGVSGSRLDGTHFSPTGTSTFTRVSGGIINVNGTRKYLVGTNFGDQSFCAWVNDMNGNNIPNDPILSAPVMTAMKWMCDVKQINKNKFFCVGIPTSANVPVTTLNLTTGLQDQTPVGTGVELFVNNGAAITTGSNNFTAAKYILLKNTSNPPSSGEIASLPTADITADVALNAGGNSFAVNWGNIANLPDYAEMRLAVSILPLV